MRTLCTVAAVFGVLVPSVVCADVLLLGDLPDDQRALLRDALGASLQQPVLTPDDLRTQLRARAETLGDDPTRASTREALEEAHRAYVQLRLGQSSVAYQQALERASASERQTADPIAIARILFERALVSLAAQQRDDAQRDLVSALQLHPGFQPDENVYGEPVRELLRDARAARPRTYRLEVQREPEDATVFVDGRAVAPGERAEVHGAGLHLVTVTRDGFAPQSLLVRGTRRPPVRVRLRAASPELLALQALQHWGDRPLTESNVAFVARAAGVERLVRARRTGDQLEVVLTTLDAEVVRQAAGTQESWEPRPFYVLAERLAGREVHPPEPGTLPGVSLAVAAPDEVEPDSTIRLRVTLRDPASLARAIAATCGDQSTRAEPQARSVLELRAPSDEGTVGCVVSALDTTDSVLVRFPTTDEGLVVGVAEPPANRVIWGVLGGALAAAAIGTAIALAFVLRDPQQVLVLEGLE